MNKCEDCGVELMEGNAPGTLECPGCGTVYVDQQTAKENEQHEADQTAR